MSSIFPMTNESSHSPRESGCCSLLMKREGELIYNTLHLLHIVSVVLGCNATLFYLICSVLIYIFFLSTSFLSCILLILCFSLLLSSYTHTHNTHIFRCTESYSILYMYESMIYHLRP